MVANTFKNWRGIEKQRGLNIYSNYHRFSDQKYNEINE